MSISVIGVKRKLRRLSSVGEHYSLKPEIFCSVICHLGHHRLTLLHREPHPYLHLAAASGGKSHLFRVLFLMSQFALLTFESYRHILRPFSSQAPPQPCLWPR